MDRLDWMLAVNECQALANVELHVFRAGCQSNESISADIRSDITRHLEAIGDLIDLRRSQLNEQHGLLPDFRSGELTRRG